MLLAVSLTGLYIFLAAVAAGYLLWSAAFKQGHEHIAWILGHLRSTPAPSAPEPPPIALAPVSVSVSLEEGPDGKRQLASIKPMYLIENKDPAEEIRDIDAGVRSYEGRESQYAPFHRELLGAGEKVTVTWEESIPRDFFEGIHESAASEVFIYWARFTRTRHRWEVSYDPRARETSYRVDVEPPATTEKAARDSATSMKRRPRLVPLDADTWRIHPIEDRGGTLMQLPVLPVDCAVANVGDDVALPHDVEASASVGHPDVTAPPSIPAGTNGTLRLSFQFLQGFRGGESIELTVPYRGPDGADYEPLRFRGRFLPPGRWEIEPISGS